MRLHIDTNKRLETAMLKDVQRFFTLCTPLVYPQGAASCGFAQGSIVFHHLRVRVLPYALHGRNSETLIFGGSHTAQCARASISHTPTNSRRGVRVWCILTSESDGIVSCGCS